MMTRIQKTIFLLMASVLIGIFAGGRVELTSAATAWQPENVALGVPGIGSMGHVAGTAMVSAITDKTGVRVVPMPTEKTLPRIELLRSKQIDFYFSPSSNTYAWRVGIAMIAKSGYGPQKVRVVWNGAPLYGGFFVRGTSKIKTVADMKGKKIIQIKGFPGMNLYYNGLMAYANLTWDDVKKIWVPSYGAGMKAILEGKADVAYAGTSSPGVLELEASPYGIRWLPMPAEDIDAWKRLRKIVGWFTPAKVTVGAGISPDKPVELMEYGYHIICYPSTDEKLSYWWTKQVHQLYDDFKDRHKYLKGWTIDECLIPGKAIAPFHPGSVKYFKEIGRWTAQLEKWQAESLAQEEGIRADWKNRYPDRENVPE
jgi:TRAP transporter TAXI family solute receptor